MFEAGNTDKNLANLIKVWIYFKFIYFCRDFFCIKLATANPYKGDPPNSWIIKENLGDQHYVINAMVMVFIFVNRMDINKEQLKSF